MMRALETKIFFGDEVDVDFETGSYNDADR